MSRPLLLLGAALLAACGSSGAPAPDLGAPPAADGALASADGGRPLDAPAAADLPGSVADLPVLVAVDAPGASDGGMGSPHLACGAPGLPCCRGGECGGGGCCVVGRCFGGGEACPTGGTCQGGSCGACGGAGQPCCRGATCTSPATTCREGQCRPCGSLDGPCCDGEVCLQRATLCATLTTGMTCRGCGAPGQSCCPDGSCGGGACCVGSRCVPPGQTCDNRPDAGVGPAGTCQDGRCSGCGGANQPCCPGGLCHADRTRCGSSDRCEPCGGLGGFCCEIVGQPPCDLGATCGALGRCEACGGPGQPCCANARCEGGGCCLDNRCIPGGQSCVQTRDGPGGTPVVTQYGLCKEGRCQGCGRPGTPCCPFPQGKALGERKQGLCDPGTTCAQSGYSDPYLCVPCGGPGQRCCDVNRCEGGCCVVNPSMGGPAVCVAAGKMCPSLATGLPPEVCQATGACGACGAPDQPCCGPYCPGGGTECKAGKCQTCGGPGDPCCGYGDCALGLVCTVRGCGFGMSGY